MKKCIILFVVTAGLIYCKPGRKPTTEIIDTKTLHPVKNDQRDQDIYSKYTYTDSHGKPIIIQNGYPRGGVKYTDPDGNDCSYAVFWTRIINETDHPMELNIDFPGHSYEISNFPGKNFKVLVPADTMTLEKFPLDVYGISNVASFLDHHIHKLSTLKRTIHPKTSSGFYFVMLISTLEATGMTRTELRL